MLLYSNPKLGVWLAANHPEAKSFHRGLKETLIGYEQKVTGYERIVTGHEQINIGTEEEPVLVDGPPIYGPGDPIYEDDLDHPIYEYGPDQFELVGWQEAWGAPPTEEDLETFQPPAPEENPVTDVEIAIRQATGNFEQARLAAPKALDRLKGTVHTALVSGGMSSDEATAAGVGLVLMHGPVLAAFEAAGGHPKAAEALYNAIASKPSTDALPWLSKGILEVFAAFLVPK